MIIGTFDNAGRPLVDVRVVFVQQRVVGQITAVVDTGADRSMLSWLDAGDVGLGEPDGKSVAMTGAAGTRVFAEVPGELFLTDSARVLYGFRLSVLIAPPMRHASLPCSARTCCATSR